MSKCCESRRSYSLNKILFYLLFLWIVVYMVYVVKIIRSGSKSTTIEKFEDKPNTFIRKKRFSTVIPKNNNIFILLQPSPVYTREQIDRLTVIDNTWATWSKSVKILASISFNNSKTAYYVFLEGLLSVVTTHPEHKFLVLGNDHSFFIPANLECFLRKLDAETPIYTGNKLQRGIYKHDYKLYFASGGAGIVVSHVSIKIFLLALAIADDSSFLEILETYYHKYGDECMAGDDVNGFTVQSIGDISRAKVVCALNEVSSKETSNLRITLSEKVQIDIQFLESKVSKVVLRRGLDSSEVVNIDRCAATTDWDRANPGLVLAYCLQAIFAVPFLLSEDHDGGERFNVYGPVRTLQGDLDEWFIDAKRDQLASVPLLPVHISSNAISFHYISTIEAGLLFRVLSKRWTPSVTELATAWPKNDKDAGPYSRWNFLNSQEIVRLHQLLTENITIGC